MLVIFLTREARDQYKEASAGDGRDTGLIPGS